MLPDWNLDMEQGWGSSIGFKGEVFLGGGGRGVRSCTLGIWSQVWENLIPQSPTSSLSIIVADF